MRASVFVRDCGMAVNRDESFAAARVRAGTAGSVS